MNFHQKTQQKKLLGTNGLKIRCNTCFHIHVYLLKNMLIYTLIVTPDIVCMQNGKFNKNFRMRKYLKEIKCFCFVFDDMFLFFLSANTFFSYIKKL